MKELNQNQAPLMCAMQAYVRDKALAFHTPGHKQGKGMHSSFKEIITPVGLAMEVSLMEELDDLHDPQTCIKAAQELAAALYGAAATYFFVNGTTGAIHAMILAVVNPGEKIIVPRNAHRSVIGGIMLSGAVPVFVQPEFDVALGIAMAVTPEAIAKAIAAHPEAKAVLVVHPTYHGVTADLKKIAELVHMHAMVLLVDEAHGAHLKFHPELPMQALDAGADIVAQSTHKLLGSLTQTSMLHVGSSCIVHSRLKAMVSLVQSTSPNYLLLASLDVARLQMATDGQVLLSKVVQLAHWAREAINQIKGLTCFGAERLTTSDAYGLDVTKLTVTVKALGLTGTAAEQILRHDYKIQAELAGADHLLFILSIGDSRAEAEALITALRGLAARFQDAPAATIDVNYRYPDLPIGVISPREALFAEKTTADFDHAAGLVCAEVITFYPPGIPVICPGERISKAVIAYCRAMVSIGLKVVGPDDCRLKTIKVVK